MPLEAFDNFPAGDDPAIRNKVAHETARALLSRVHKSTDPSVVKRTVKYTAEHGVGDIAELWAKSSPNTLPGALWRMYLVHAAVSRDVETAAEAFSRGAARDYSINTIIAGAVDLTGPAEIRDLTDEILRGVFTGDFADALNRAASFCAVMSLGFGTLADDLESGSYVDESHAELARIFVARSARYLEYARDLSHCALLHKRGILD